MDRASASSFPDHAAEKKVGTFMSDSASDPYEGYINDAENAAEMARLMVQEQLLTQAMGGVLAEQTDLSGIRHVLDLGCGPGGWILSVAQQYPDIQAGSSWFLVSH
jgi:tRNA G46 methylase TrmB